MSLSSRAHADSLPGGLLAPSAYTLTAHGPADPQRGAVEDFIRDVFARRYGAQVPHFAPMLVGLREGGELLAAAGYRNAATAPLFLERYLPAPVDTLLTMHADVRPARERIAEVGHLAAGRSGEGRRLVQLLAPHLASEGFEWVVGTVTQELRRMLLRLGIVPLTLGAADPAALGDEAGHWGSYYDHRPVVLAGQLSRALRRHGGLRSKASGVSE
ncbi:thermostable hemolysin [Variovorax ginsengisoli]|uniref:thermostable hemolysin n=1 Tax=Variovorax ginsengisoli TaxID=363844 RepID=UPI003F50F082